MADNPEVSQWEPGIYQLEQTDEVLGGVGGVSNRPNVEIGNRTARIKTALDEQGIFVDETEHEFAGANVDPTAVFEGSVSDGDLVWYDKSQNRYELTIPLGTPPSGIADVTRGRVVTGGLMLVPNIASLSSPHVMCYMSDSVSGGKTTVKSTFAIGRILWLNSPGDGIVALNMSIVQNHSELRQDQANLHFTEASIAHSRIIDDEPSQHFTVGSINHSAINDNEASKHRLINDVGVSTTQLWSSSKIDTAINNAGGAHAPGVDVFSRAAMRYNWDQGAYNQQFNIHTGTFPPPSGPGQTSYRRDNGDGGGYPISNAIPASQWTVYALPEFFANIYLTAASPRYIVCQGALLNNSNNTNCGIRLMMGPAGSGGTGSGNVLSTIGGPYGNLNYGVGTCGVRGHSGSPDYGYSFMIILDTNSLAHNQFYSFNVQLYRESSSNGWLAYMKCYWNSAATNLLPYHTPL